MKRSFTFGKSLVRHPPDCDFIIASGEGPAWFTYPGNHADREWQVLCYSASYRHISSLEKRANHAILLLLGISRAVLLLLRTEKRPCDAREEEAYGDPAVIAAHIGLAGVIVGALLVGAYALKQPRRNAQLEQRSQEEHFRHEQEMLRDAKRTG